MHKPMVFPWHAPTLRTRLLVVAATFLFGLHIDLHGGLAGQLAVSVWTWGVMFWLLRELKPAERLPYWVCLVWATAGEIFLSLIWVLYTYRLENIPFFIPPGHVLLFWAGLVIAPRIPRAMMVAVAALAAAYGIGCWAIGHDTLSVLLVVMFLACMMQKEGRRLYAVMFIASLLVEIYGTWLGNWVWHAQVSYSSFNSANPPLAAGAFYCMLDVLVVLTVRGLARRAGAGVAPNSA